MKIGVKINQLREGRPYPLVAEEVGCSEGTLRQLESGKIESPRVALCLRLAQYFGVSLDWLADDTQGWDQRETDKDRATAMVERALASAGLAGELSKDESDMLATFRAMPEKLQMVALGYIIGLSGGSSQQDRAKAEAAGRVVVEERAKSQAKKSSSKKIG